MKEGRVESAVEMARAVCGNEGVREVETRVTEYQTDHAAQRFSACILANVDGDWVQLHAKPEFGETRQLAQSAALRAVKDFVIKRHESLSLALEWLQLNASAYDA